MASSFHFVVANLVLVFVVACSQQDAGPWSYYCRSRTRPDPNLVTANINNLLALMLRASQMNTGFSGLSSGSGNNTVYGLAQCWGVTDIIKQHCYPGIQGAVQKLHNDCPGSTDAQIWYDYCTVRYSLDNFFGTFDASKYALVRNRDNYKDPKSLFSKLGPLFDYIISKIADPAYRGIARAQTDLPDGDTLYGGAQCTPDLRPSECARCVDAAVKRFDNSCKPKQGCRVYLSSCLARYEVFNFSFPLTLGSRKSMMISSL